MLGDEFRLVPEIELGPEQGEELAHALAASESGELTRFLTDEAEVDLPVDEWLYGVARVREQLGAWEAVVMLAGGFGRPEPELVPLQLPVRRPATTGWPCGSRPTAPSTATGCSTPPTTPRPFDRRAPQCGLLLDEWTEVIPGDDARRPGSPSTTTGPNAEPPQAMLLRHAARRRTARGGGTTSSARWTRRSTSPRCARSSRPSSTRRPTRGSCPPRSWPRRCAASRSRPTCCRERRLTTLEVTADG